MKGKTPTALMLRFVWLESLVQDYTNEEIGHLIRDLYGYARDGEIPQQYEDRGMRGLWRSMKDGIDKDFAKYREKSKKAAASANARWGKATQAGIESKMQSNANASENMQSHLTECAGVHSHCTYTDTISTITPIAASSAAVAPHKGALGGKTVLNTNSLTDGETEEARKKFLESVKHPAWPVAHGNQPDIEIEKEG